MSVSTLSRVPWEEWEMEIEAYTLLILFCINDISINRHLGCFHVLSIVNNATVNMEVQIYSAVSAFVS